MVAKLARARMRFTFWRTRHLRILVDDDGAVVVGGGPRGAAFWVWKGRKGGQLNSNKLKCLKIDPIFYKCFWNILSNKRNVALVEPHRAFFLRWEINLLWLKSVCCLIECTDNFSCAGKVSLSYHETIISIHRLQWLFRESLTHPRRIVKYCFGIVWYSLQSEFWFSMKMEKECFVRVWVFKTLQNKGKYNLGVRSFDK